MIYWNHLLLYVKVENYIFNAENINKSDLTDLSLKCGLESLVETSGDHYKLKNIEWWSMILSD